MLQDSLQKISLKEIAQTPFAYALYVTTLVLVSVIITNRADYNRLQSAYNALEQKKNNEADSIKKERDFYLKSFYVQKAVVDQIQQKVDSTAVANYNKRKR